MLIQRGIMKNPLDGCDGKSASGGLVYSFSCLSGNIYSGQGCVVTEREPVGVSGLPMLKPGILFCIPVDKLDLESGVVDEKDISCRQIRISTEKNLSHDLVPAPEFHDHDPDLSSEGLAFDYGGVKVNLFAINVDGLPVEHIIPEIMDVDSPVKFLRTAASCLPWASIEVLQYRVITQSAHHAESESGSPHDKIIACKQAVPYKNVGNTEKLILVLEYRPQALRCLVVALILHVFKIERSAASCGERNCLHCEKESGIADSGGHLSETENLKTPFYFTGTSRPVFAKSRSFLARFTEEAVIKSDGDPVPAFFKKHPRVEGAPVELLFEVLPEATLAGLSMSGHRQEIQFSVYSQYQNHCLDEETFEIFSYLSGPIERGSYNRSYLVKWLNFIHNLLINSFKVTKNLALGQILLPLILLKINKMSMFYSMYF